MDKETSLIFFKRFVCFGNILCVYSLEEMSPKSCFNRRYKLNTNTSHSLEDLNTLTGISVKRLKGVFDRACREAVNYDVDAKAFAWSCVYKYANTH